MPVEKEKHERSFPLGCARAARIRTTIALIDVFVLRNCFCNEIHYFIELFIIRLFIWWLGIFT